MRDKPKRGKRRSLNRIERHTRRREFLQAVRDLSGGGREVLVNGRRVRLA